MRVLEHNASQKNAELEVVSFSLLCASLLQERDISLLNGCCDTVLVNWLFVIGQYLCVL